MFLKHSIEEKGYFPNSLSKKGIAGLMLSYVVLYFSECFLQLYGALQSWGSKENHQGQQCFSKSYMILVESGSLSILFLFWGSELVHRAYMRPFIRDGVQSIVLRSKFLSFSFFR